jgi:hypothetical protein
MKIAHDRDSTRTRTFENLKTTTEQHQTAKTSKTILRERRKSPPSQWRRRRHWCG